MITLLYKQKGSPPVGTTSLEYTVGGVKVKKACCQILAEFRKTSALSSISIKLYLHQKRVEFFKLCTYTVYALSHNQIYKRNRITVVFLSEQKHRTIQGIRAVSQKRKSC